MPLFPLQKHVISPSPEKIQSTSLSLAPRAKPSRRHRIQIRQRSRRSDRYRYIRYQNGDEELYDHATDSHEWHNLADSERHAKIKEELSDWIAKDWADSAPTKRALTFDHNAFRWTHKKTGKTTFGKDK